MKQLHTDTPQPLNSAAAYAAPAQPDPVIDKATALAAQAHVRNPRYPGFEAVRDLYDQYL